jgi:virginiamycin B lyase
MFTLKRLLPTGLALAIALACAPAALAVNYRLDAFDATAGAGGSSEPNGITLGPDGNVWFADGNANQLGRVTPAGAVTRFPLAGKPIFVTSGPDGALWATRQTANDVVRVSTTGTVLSNFILPNPGAYPYGITTGSDGNLWFTEFSASPSRVARLTPSFSYADANEPGQPTGVVAGPDGNMWVAGGYGDDILKYPTSLGAPTSYPVTASSRPGDITRGPDGRLWFTEWDAGQVGAITTAGLVNEYPVPGRLATSGIARSEDGGLWVGSYDATRAYIERINTSGHVTHTLALPAGSGVNVITAGPPGTNTIWFTDGGLDRIWRISAVPDVPSPPHAGVDARPVLTLKGPRKRPRLTGRRGGRVTVSATCSEICDLAAKAHLRTKRKIKASRPVEKQDVAAGRTVKLTLKLSRKAKRAARRALRHKRRARVVVTVTATDSAGQTTVATARVKLKR